MGTSQNKLLTQHTANGVVVLTFTEPTLNADAVTEALTVINASRNRKIIFDLQSVRFLVGGSLRPDQEPFTLLLKLAKQLTDAGGRLVLCHVTPEIAEVFRVLRMDQVVEIQPSVNSAVACMDRLPETKIPGYSHTQRAPLCLILYGSAFLCFVLAGTVGDIPGIFVAGGVGLLIALLAPAFHYLKVEDRGELLAIRFGPVPLFRRTVRYADIVKVEAGRTLLLDGWGIHYSIRGGWLWNIWGRDCVVVHFQKGVLRIGTDDAANLAGFVRTRIIGGNS